MRHETPVTRPGALSTLRRLALGLGPDLAGVARLLERASQHDDAEALRAALVEVGARTLLDATLQGSNP